MAVDRIKALGNLSCSLIIILGFSLQFYAVVMKGIETVVNSLTRKLKGTKTLC